MYCIPSYATQDYKIIKWLDGNWEGMKYQTNTDKAWKIKLSCNSKKGIYRVEYSDLNCIGYLVLTNLKGKTAFFTEKIDKGSCVHDGYVIITLVTKNLISFTCLRDNKTRLASYCTIQKTNDDGG